jgi:hypothetical protein
MTAVENQEYVWTCCSVNETLSFLPDNVVQVIRNLIWC